MSRSGEFDWIAQYLAPLAADGSFGLLDDAALLDMPADQSLIVTQDAIAADIHFLANDPLDLIARKALRVNISDSIAKGAQPLWYSLALGVPDRWQDSDMKKFAEGLAQDQTQYGIKLVGGDTYRSPDRLCIAVTMFAPIKKENYVSRLGAENGDLVFVTGTIGDAALGLQVATDQMSVGGKSRDAFIDAYRLPKPPVGVAGAVATCASASMDISDGLLGDCRKLCAASNVGAIIQRHKVPLSTHSKQVLAGNAELWQTVLTGGDDYQVLCTIPHARAEEFQHLCAEAEVHTTQIGAIRSAERSEVALDIDGVEVSIHSDSYTHF